MTFFLFCFVWHLPDLGSKDTKFVQDTSRFWYKPDISRDQGKCVNIGLGDSGGKYLFNVTSLDLAYLFSYLWAAITVLKDKEPGSFIVRDSHSFRGAYGLAMKVATPPPSVLQQSKKGNLLWKFVIPGIVSTWQ